MKKFLSGLQRRKVLRVALTLQAAMKLPDSFATIVAAALLLGFPAAVPGGGGG